MGTKCNGDCENCGQCEIVTEEQDEEDEEEGK